MDHQESDSEDRCEEKFINDRKKTLWARLGNDQTRRPEVASEKYLDHGQNDCQNGEEGRFKIA